jgi:hypothetical protein
LRVLIVNNKLVNLLLQSGKPEKAEMVYHESELLVTKPQMHLQAVLDFYFTVVLLFKKINDDATTTRYQQMHPGKINALRKSGYQRRIIL